MAQLPLPGIRLVTTPPASGLGTQAPAAGVLINQYLDIIDEHDAQILNLFSATSGLSPGGLTASQMDIQGLTQVGTAPAFGLSVDQGLQAYVGNGVVNANLPYNLLSSAIDFVLQPNGTVGANGALTLDTTNPLLEVFDGCYMFFPAGKAYSGSEAGWYWTVMSSTSAGTIYDNQYQDRQPMVPTTLVPIVDAGPGAYTQLTNTGIQGPSAPLLAGVLGTQGSVEYRARWSNSTDSANTKFLAPIFGSTNALAAGNESATSTQFHDSTCLVTNRGKATSQRSYVSSTTGPSRLSVDTTKNQTICYNMQINVGTSWLALHQVNFRVYPVAMLETPAPQIMTASGPTIVPPGAALLGLTASNLKLYLQPLASDVSGYSAGAFDNNTASYFNAGLYYKSKPPFTIACMSNVVKNGRPMMAFKYDAQNTVMSICMQTQNSVANRTGYIDNSKKWYVEACFALDSNDPDHWPAFWAMPQKHKNGDTNNYVEKDIVEGGGTSAKAARSGRVYLGALTSSLNWTYSGGSFSVATSNNSQSGVDWGMPFDWTLFNTFGYSFDPSTNLAKYYVNGVLWWTKDETAYAANQLNDLYYLILSVQSTGLHKQYTMFVDHISIWQ